MADASRDDEDLAGPERHGVLTLTFDPEDSRPAKKELILLVVMPRELSMS
jgi:hypothetical protein